MKLKLIGTFLFLFVFTSSVFGQRVIEADDLWKMERIGAPQVSSQGAIAFTVTNYDISTNGSNTTIWLMRDNSDTPRMFTSGGSDGNPVFSPDGNYLAFTSRRGGGPAQLYVMPVYGGEAKQITNIPVAVTAPKWFPDGQRLAFSSTVHPDYNGDWDEQSRIMQQQRDSRMTAKVTENRIYRHWDRWLTHGMYPRLFSTTLDGEVVDLMPNSQQFFAMMGAPGYDISPDGTEIAISANATPPPYEYLNYDIYLLSTDGSGDMVNITEHNPANDTSPSYSPDGRFIMYGKQRSTHFYADNVRLVVYDRHTGEREVLTEEIDMSFSNWNWSEDGNTIFFSAQDRGMTSVFSFDMDSREVSEVFRGGSNGGLALYHNDKILFTHTTFERPAEIFSINRSGGTPVKLTEFNDERISELNYGRSESITYKGANDVDVQMFMVYPPDFDENKEYPLVMMIHGGPHGIFGDQFHYRWNAHLFAAPGYVVALPNFHGSTSFGQEFAESIHGNHADLPFRDIMKAADYLSERPYVDGSRMAAAGGSYGGYMVSWIAGHTDRFSALVNHAGVYNIMGQFASDVTQHRVQAYSGAPWDGLDSMLRFNPAMFAENFETPMLVFHGELDYRVPVLQGLEVYGVYKGKGLDARLVYFPDENHWILSAQNSIYWYEELHNWLERYLKD